MRSLHAALSLCLVAPVFLGADGCEDPGRETTVRLVDGDGAPAVGVMVVRGLALDAVAYTDAKGEVRFTDLGPREPVTAVWRYFVDRPSGWDRDYTELRTYVGLRPGQEVEIRWYERISVSSDIIALGEITGFDDAQPDSGWLVQTEDPRGGTFEEGGSGWSDPQPFDVATTGRAGSVILAGQYAEDPEAGFNAWDIPLRMGLQPVDIRGPMHMELDTSVSHILHIDAKGLDPRVDGTWHDYTLSFDTGASLFFSNPLRPLDDPRAWEMRTPSTLNHLPPGTAVEVEAWANGPDISQTYVQRMVPPDIMTVTLPPVADLEAAPDDLEGGDMRGRSFPVDGAEDAAALLGAFYYFHYAADGSVNQRIYWLVRDLDAAGSLTFPQVPAEMMALPEAEENAWAILNASGIHGDDPEVDVWLTGGAPVLGYGAGTSGVERRFGPIFTARAQVGAQAQVKVQPLDLRGVRGELAPLQ